MDFLKEINFKMNDECVNRIAIKARVTLSVINTIHPMMKEKIITEGNVDFQLDKVFTTLMISPEAVVGLDNKIILDEMGKQLDELRKQINDPKEWKRMQEEEGL